MILFGKLLNLTYINIPIISHKFAKVCRFTGSIVVVLWVNISFRLMLETFSICRWLRDVGTLSFIIGGMVTFCVVITIALIIQIVVGSPQVERNFVIWEIMTYEDFKSHLIQMLLLYFPQ